MAKYQQYEEYRDSGIEWLGVIPKDWISTQVKYGYTVVLGKMLQTTPKSNSDLLKPYLKAQNVQPSGIDLTNVGLMWFSFDERKRLLLKKKDILVSEGGDVGRAAIWNNEIEECYIQNAINRVRPRYNNDSRFFYYWINYLKSTDFINIICNKATIAHYTADKLQGSPLILPSALEQIQIANFLDHETAQIDTLIEKQQTLLQLLKEKRQAVISHAVTKGLNPDAPMKDSGVEWLGAVPEHWEVGRLKNVLRIRNGRDYKEVEVESGGYPVYGSGGIFKRSSDYLFDGESVLFGRKGTVDKPLLVSGKFWTVDTMFYSEASSNAKPNYIYHQALLFPFDQLSTNTALPSMTQENLLELGFVIPPFDEQEQICQYLSDKLKVFSNLVSKAEQAIQLMQERRTALISAAVTGKIDVRGWQAPE